MELTSSQMDYEKPKLTLLIDLSKNLELVDMGKFITGISQQGILTNKLIKQIIIKGMYHFLNKIKHDNLKKSIE